MVLELMKHLHINEFILNYYQLLLLLLYPNSPFRIR